jgi:NDP-sugar pyrophosphorylase family protein
MTSRLSANAKWYMPKMPDAIVLCGGAGLRLRDVTGSGPKSMAAVAGRPFLELLFAQLRRNGFENAILAVGYQQDVIRSYFGERAHGLHLKYSAESSPLGTGGALRHAVDLIQSGTVLIMNGDSYTDVDLIRFVDDHDESEADASMIVVPIDDRTDCGSVALDQEHRLVRFEEKEAFSGAPYINAGIYLAARSLLCDIPSGRQLSLERELFPWWMNKGYYLRGSVHMGACVDIGTPERYRGAQSILAGAEVQQHGGSGKGSHQ